MAVGMQKSFPLTTIAGKHTCGQPYTVYMQRDQPNEEMMALHCDTCHREVQVLIPIPAGDDQAFARHQWYLGRLIGLLTRDEPQRGK